MKMGRGRDRAAEIEAVYRARYGAFLRVAVGIVGSEQLGEEVVHEAFVRALRHRSGFGGRGSLEGWLWRIVLNEARRLGAAERQAPEPTPLTLAYEPPSANRAGEHRGVEALVAALPERQRLALFLRYYADLDYEAIAEALGVKPGTVAGTLHAAHSALRRQLSEVER